MEYPSLMRDGMSPRQLKEAVGEQTIRITFSPLSQGAKDKLFDNMRAEYERRMKTARPKCDHYFLIRKGGICHECGTTFQRNYGRG